jgi:hypothetical protein
LANPAGIADAGFIPMKTRCLKSGSQAMTLVEALVVICVLFFLFIILATIPEMGAKANSQRIACVNNLKQIGLAYRIWEGDHGDKYPMSVSVTNGGAMEFAATGNVTAIFQVMSNELSTPKILFCPADERRSDTTNFSTGFSAQNISYFIGLDADETNPQTLLSGDDNFEIGGAPVQSGLLLISSNAPIAWSAARHKFFGNLLLSDGSVMQSTQSELKRLIQQTGLATNHLAIP